MSVLKLNETFAKDFVKAEEMKSITPEIVAAYRTLANKSGEGNDFLGWVDLPVNYDKEEFARIELAAEKIKKAAIFSLFSASAARTSALARQLNL